MFSDQLVATVSRLDITDAEANRIFRSNIRLTLETFLRFAHRYWFHEVSNQAQSREIFQLVRRHLDLDALYQEVREELQDMGNFLDVEAMRRQNETVVRLTVVTTFGLIGTVTTGFIGMNLFDWTEQSAAWRLAAFLIVFVPTMFLTLYTVVKSRRLSEFLDALSDEKVGFGGRWRTFWRVWKRG
jgi:Mg2+ and Co2+ transporter CorA